MQVTILDKIKNYKLQEVAEAKQRHSVYDLQQLSLGQTMPRGFLKALKNKRDADNIALIAEIKRASPSKGLIRSDFDVATLAKAYENGGATCLSILTDAPSFQGHNDFLAIGRDVVSLPVLRKDFMFDPYQIIESRAIGADCILLIMACLDDAQAIELEQVAMELGMDVLVETHNQSELERALNCLKSDLIGINNRNLHDFVTDLAVSETLSAFVPDTKFLVSESGIFTPQDIERLQKVNIHSFLVGESLMRQDDVTKATADLIGKKI